MEKLAGLRVAKLRPVMVRSRKIFACDNDWPARLAGAVVGDTLADAREIRGIAQGAKPPWMRFLHPFWGIP
ncbi:MAG: hypothetical protein K2G93_06675, partial [Rikenella sp.]|nr:hypothetical protein [Rikenella sp.]